MKNPLTQRTTIWGVFKVALMVGSLAGVAYVTLIGISVFRHPSVDNDPGIFVYVSPYIFLLAAFPSFVLTVIVCSLRQSYLSRSA